MAATMTEQSVHVLEILKEEEIAALIDVASNRWAPRTRRQKRGTCR